MPKYRKKPIVIDAIQVTPENWNNISEDIWFGPGSGRYYIKTLEGDMVFDIGDWIVTGIAGEQYACKDSIFQETYDPA